ncbi:hypothetical protein P5V15_014664 [Pogonomyrmex californicus]
MGKTYDKISQAQSIARDNLIKAKHKSKYYYDWKSKERNLRIGDNVYLLKELIRNKLADQYTGPFEIIRLLENNNVKILIKHSKTRIVHIDKLKRKESRSLHLAEPPPGIEEDITSLKGSECIQPPQPKHGPTSNSNPHSTNPHGRTDRLQMWKKWTEHNRTITSRYRKM